MREELEALLSAEPFVPFRMTLTSGDKIEIWNANALTVADAVLYVMDATSEGHTIIAANQVVLVQVLA